MFKEIWDYFKNLGEYNGFFISREIAEIKVKVKYKAYLKLTNYTRKINTEWGGLLVVNKRDNVLVVEDVLLLPQSASLSYFKLNPKELSKALEGYARNSPELLPKLKGWAHSHVNMNVYWSGEDDDTFVGLCRYFGDFVLGVVVNKNKEQRWRVDINTSAFGRMVADNLIAEIILENGAAKKEYLKEIRRDLIKWEEWKNRIPKAVRYFKSQILQR